MIRIIFRDLVMLGVRFKISLLIPFDRSKSMVTARTSGSKTNVFSFQFWC